MLALGIWSALSSSRPSVILITIDTLRPDRLGCYGHPTNHTPAIDRLAAEGTLFEQAYCDIPWTTGSMSSVMTGTYGRTHGVQLPTHRLSQDAVTLAEILSAHGYQTAAIIGSFPLAAVYGLDQGFETYDEDFSRPIFEIPGQPIEKLPMEFQEDLKEHAAFVQRKLLNDAYRPDEEVTDAAIRWLARGRDGRPLFLWVHYFGPHEKLRGDVGFLEQEPRIIAAYDPDVEATDRAVGRLLDDLSMTDVGPEPLVVLHADHGQSLGEHDYVGHGQDLYDVSTRIPLIVHAPGHIRAGTRRRDLARNLDLLPTILAAARIEAPSNVVGHSLLTGPTARSSGESNPELAYFDTEASTVVPVALSVPGVEGTILAPTSRTGIRTPAWKLLVDHVVGPCQRGDRLTRDPLGNRVLVNPVQLDEQQCRKIENIELYAASDPEEPQFNQAERRPEVVAELQALIARTQAAATTGHHDEFKLSPEQEQKLKSLGYLR